jgi:hypothetical protein
VNVPFLVRAWVLLRVPSLALRRVTLPWALPSAQLPAAWAVL